MNPRLAAAAAMLVLASAAGCSSAATTPKAVPGGSGYWTRQRLLGAGTFWHGHRAPLPSPGSTPTPKQDARVPRVGALFDSDTSGDHFCTASVVDSTAGNVLITAAHCINSGTGGANRSNIVFIPEYANGNSPDGVWTPERYVIDPHWVSDADPDLDVAFIVLNPLNGKSIQDVLGANQIAFNDGFQHLVRVAGYPDSGSAPISCLNWTSQQSPTQLQFNCADFTGGTSGSPWITNVNPLTRSGTIIGVIGGYQEGGNTPSVSYAAYLDDNIEKLYNEANSS